MPKHRVEVVCTTTRVKTFIIEAENISEAIVRAEELAHDLDIGAISGSSEYEGRVITTNDDPPVKLI